MSRRQDSKVKKRTVTNAFSPRGRYFRKEPERREKVDRNAPCPCGSGKKYKNCCLHPKGFLAKIKRFFSKYEA